MRTATLFPLVLLAAACGGSVPQPLTPPHLDIPVAPLETASPAMASNAPTCPPCPACAAPGVASQSSTAPQGTSASAH